MVEVDRQTFSPAFGTLGMKGTGDGHVRIEGIPVEVIDSRLELTVQGGSIRVRAMRMRYDLNHHEY